MEKRIETATEIITVIDNVIHVERKIPRNFSFANIGADIIEKAKAQPAQPRKYTLFINDFHVRSGSYDDMVDFAAQASTNPHDSIIIC